MELFITGTDTDVGKTMCSLFLLRALQNRDKSKSLTYFKPVQSGSILGTDSDYIRKHSRGINIPTESYCFEEPVSPNRVAQKYGVNISFDKISKDKQSLSGDFILVEGAGGLEVPINETQRISDLIKTLDMPAIVVASTKLGTINHTVLTVEMAKAKGIDVKGIILTGSEDEGLKDLLISQTGVPVVAEIPFIEDKDFQTALEKSHTFFETSFLNEILENNKDDQAIWYPFTQHKLRKENYEVERGEGSYLYLKNGQRLFDSISSWWVNLHGHSNREIADAIYKQAKELEHVILAGFNHQPAKMLSRELISLTKECGADFEKVFFSDNGSTAVEVSLKMAYQYHQNIGKTRMKLLSLKDAYHGDTIGAMSVSEREGFHTKFEKLLFDVDFVTPDNFDELKSIEDPSEYAAFIVEPLVQGAGGMKFYSEDYLREIRSFCSKHGILLIFDEVFTGFGRLEHLFAFERAKVKPDIMCVSKGISGGFLPISATLATKQIYDSFLSDKIEDAFLHGHSYTGNPISCAASLASLKILRSQESKMARRLISSVTKERIEKLERSGVIKNARSLGTIGAFELDDNEDYFSSDFSYRFFKRAMERGALLRPLGKTIYTVPPYSSTAEDIHFVYNVIEELIHEFKC